jgi:lipopolysaccharide transport system ATP-binding protein
MNKCTVRVSNLSKQYVLSGQPSNGYRTLRESVSNAFSVPWHRWKSQVRPAHLRPPAIQNDTGRQYGNDFWALRDISFDVQPGDVVGVIGGNGAGKSTFLKILSRITEPTTGRVELRGRVGSLLEVGTGFHQELSGRENIYLNGAILGMSRREIARKFDEIVEFADVGPFLDTPVKRYSSGMFVRLAFAVASHLEPEILIVDEVLAVGDQAFQKKCLGKMGEVSRSGRTVLFVSHNMSSIKSLCSRAVLFKDGRLAMNGAVDDVVNRYLSSTDINGPTGRISATAPRLTNGDAAFEEVQLTNLSGTPVRTLFLGQSLRVQSTCRIIRDIPDGHFEISISTADGCHVFYATTIDGGISPRYLTQGTHTIEAKFHATLLPNRYTIDLGVHHHNGATADFVQRTLDFEVLKVAESGLDHYMWPKVRGLVRPHVEWSHAPAARLRQNAADAKCAALE